MASAGGYDLRPCSPLSKIMDYRAFIIGEDGHVNGRVDLLCENGTEAVEKAKQLVDGDDIEFWHRDHSIARFRHNEPSG